MTYSWVAIWKTFRTHSRSFFIFVIPRRIETKELIKNPQKINENKWQNSNLVFFFAISTPEAGKPARVWRIFQKHRESIRNVLALSSANLIYNLPPISPGGERKNKQQNENERFNSPPLTSPPVIVVAHFVELHSDGTGVGCMRSLFSSAFERCQLKVGIGL